MSQFDPKRKQSSAGIHGAATYGVIGETMAELPEPVTRMFAEIMGSAVGSAKKADNQVDQRQATFERRYKLLELKERREDRALKRRELELSQGRGIKFTSGQATVAGATLALLSAVIGGLIQSVATSDVEAGKNKAQIAIEELKVRGNIDLEKQKQDAAERLDRAKFETTLILSVRPESS